MNIGAVILSWALDLNTQLNPAYRNSIPKDALLRFAISLLVIFQLCSPLKKVLCETKNKVFQLNLIEESGHLLKVV